MSDKIKRVLPPAGYAAKEFGDVIKTFKENYLSGVENGASVSVYFKGSLVVNSWTGFADEQARRPWKEDVMGFFYSGSKYLSSIVIATLVERGLLSYEERISKYWPKFGQNGKEDITLSMLLSHTAGLSLLDENYELEWMRSKPGLFLDRLEKQRPLWTPGTKIGYSALVVGPYLNEIVKRVDPQRRTLSEFFHDEIAVPFGLDAYMGIPKTLHYRTPRLAWKQNSKEELQKMLANFRGDLDLYRKGLYQPKDWNSRYRMNDPGFADLPVPSSHVIGTSKAMAKVAGIVGNGGLEEGKRLLSQASIENLQKLVHHGDDVMVGLYSSAGLGTMLIPVRQGNKTWFVFGHSGLGGQVILSDSVKGLGFAYCTNYADVFSTLENNKWRPLLESVYSCIQRMDGSSEKIRLFGSYPEFLNDLRDNPVSSQL